MKFPEKEIYALYQAGKTDREIQDLTGIDRKRIGAWRRKNRYPTNPYIRPRRQNYICYAKDGDTIVCQGDAAECAKAMGYKSVDVFYSVYCQFMRSGTGRYRVYREETDV